MPTLAAFFQAPGILGWAALAAVPIIIHLLTRRRVVQLPWAAMNFLRAAHKKTRRRIQIENLLLLMLRVLAILLLVTAAAHPFLTSASPLADLAVSRRHLAVVVDVSASMGFDDGTGPVFARARRAAETILGRLEAGAGHTATLIPHAAPAAPGETEGRAGGYLDPERLQGILQGLEVSDRATSYADALEAARRALAPYRTGKEVYLILDLQRIGFGGEADGAVERPSTQNTRSDGHQGVRDALDRIVAEGAVIRIVDVGAAAVHPDNAGIVAFHAPPRVVTPAAGAVMEARVKNFGPAPKDLAVRFYVGAEANPRGTSRPRTLEPGQEASFLFHHSFKREGPVVVRAVLSPVDNYAADDERLLVVPVRPRVKVLLVGGDSHGTEAFEAPTYFLARALNPFATESDVQGPFAPEVIPWHALPRTDLAGYDVVVLADCPVPGDGEIATLRTFVEAGGGLLITWGPNTDPALARERLLEKHKLLPVVPERVAGEADWQDPRHRRFGLTLGARHPALRQFHGDDDLRTWLESSVRVGRYLVSTRAKDARDSVRVLLAYDDEAKSPALAERLVGAGRVVVLTTTAHIRWNNLPVDRQAPLFLMLVNNLANHLTVPAKDPFNLTVGDPLVRLYTAFPGKRALERPSGSGEVITPIRLGKGEGSEEKRAAAAGASAADAAAADASGNDTPADDTAGVETSRFLVRSAPLLERGVYRLKREGTRLGSGPALELFAVNPDPIEGDLRRFRAADLRADVLKEIPFEAPELDRLESGAASGPKGGELWKWLIAAALFCLVAEMIAAQRIGARQK